MSHPLVASDRVEAAVVYGPGGQKIGTIERLMVEKLSGTVAYAVVKSGTSYRAYFEASIPSGSIPLQRAVEAVRTS